LSHLNQPKAPASQVKNHSTSSRGCTACKGGRSTSPTQKASNLLQPLSSHSLKQIIYLQENMPFSLVTLFEPLFFPGTVSALFGHHITQVCSLN